MTVVETFEVLYGKRNVVGLCVAGSYAQNDSPSRVFVTIVLVSLIIYTEASEDTYLLSRASSCICIIMYVILMLSVLTNLLKTIIILDTGLHLLRIAFLDFD
jgi:hypothetical protein